MPFDGHSDERADIIARLTILGDIAAKQPDGREKSFETCLWSRASASKALRAAGLPTNVTTVHAIERFFGLNDGEYRCLWSSSPIATKRAVIARLLAKLTEASPCGLSR